MASNSATPTQQVDDGEETTTTTGSDSESASGVASEPSSRADTPGPMPKFQYSKDDLMTIAASNDRRHSCLHKDFDSAEGLWDPERWILSVRGEPRGSRGSSPLTLAPNRGLEPRGRKVIELEREGLKRKTSADPKARLREEEEDGLGIVLSPQRRSFMTGCHVTGGSRGGRVSPTEDRPQRRIGSGRINIDREERGLSYPEREQRSGRFDDREPERDRRDRDLDRDDDRRREERDRSEGGGRWERRGDLDRRGDIDRRDLNRRDLDRRDLDRDRRGRFDREDSRDERRRDDRTEDRGGRWDRRDDDLSGRDWRRDDRRDDDRYDNRRGKFGRRDHRGRHESETEPEWFTAGPTSKHDVIELRGFNKPDPESRRSASEGPKEEAPSEPVPKQDHSDSSSAAPGGPPPGAPPEGAHPSTDAGSADHPTGTGFDFNQFFSIDSIPGLEGEGPETEEVPVPTGGSRFKQWFAAGGGSQPGSRTTSRQSSLGEEAFGHLLRDMVAGYTNVPSPPALAEHLRGMSPRDSPNILDMLQTAASMGIPGMQPVPEHDPRMHQHQADPRGQPQMPHGHLPPGHPAMQHHPQAQGQPPMPPHMYQGPPPHGHGPPPGHMPPPHQHQHQAPPQHDPRQQAPSSGHSAPRPAQGHDQGHGHDQRRSSAAADIERSLKSMLFSGASSGKSTPTSHNSSIESLGVPRGKVTTLAELEANFANMPRPSAEPPQHHRPAPHQQPPPASRPTHFQAPPPALAGHAHADARSPASCTDMTAFNKLLGMMQQAGTIQGQQQQQQQQQQGTPDMAGRRDREGKQVISPSTMMMLNQKNISPQQQQQIVSQQKELLQKMVAQQQQQDQQKAIQKQIQAQLQHAKLKQAQHQQLKQQQLQQQQRELQQKQIQLQKLIEENTMCHAMAIRNKNHPQSKIYSKRHKQLIMTKKELYLDMQCVVQAERKMRAEKAAAAQAAAAQQHAQSAAAAAQLPSATHPPGAPHLTAAQQQQLLQHQQQLKQQQQNAQLQEQLLKLVGKQNPTIVAKAASPLPPAVSSTLGLPANQNNSHATSPAAPAQPIQGLFKQTTSPRAPSPIMFGSQPPMHLAAPAPIHPTSPGATSPNTLQPTSPARVPSPQELVAHTQAIMQKALIKKQLEDQKERFMKKHQQHDGQVPTKSPLPPGALTTPVAVPPGVMTSASVTPAFMPTSVIRKLANEKLDERDRRRGSLDGSQDAPEAHSTPTRPTHVTPGSAGSQQRTPTVSISTEAGTVTLLDPASQQNTAASGEETPGQPPHMRPLVGSGVMQAPGMFGQAGPGRPIVRGTGSAVAPSQETSPPSQRPIMGAHGHPAPSGHPGPSIDLTRLLEQQRIHSQPPNAAGRGPATIISPTSPQMPRAHPGAYDMPRAQPGAPYAGLAGRVPAHPAQPQPGQGIGPGTNPLLLQQLMQRGQISVGQLSQINQLAALQQQNARSAPPPPRPAPGQVYPPGSAAAALVSPPAPHPRAGLTPAALAALAQGRNVSPQQFAFQKQAAGQMHGARGAGVDPNLARLFGADILKHQAPSMPPLPMQGQKVLTVDEIERLQAM